VLPVTARSIRLFLHVLGATVWVGGQLSLGAIVPALRPYGVEPLRAAARAFQRVAWAAYLLLIVTGVWNLFAVHAADQSKPNASRPPPCRASARACHSSSPSPPPSSASSWPDSREV